MESKALAVIKKLLFEFIVVVFLIGFFSSSFANYTVPKVNSVLAYSGNIEKTFPIEGKIEYKQVHKVRLGASAIIEENFIDVGKEVEEGEPIFRINLNYGIEDMEKQLMSLEVELEKENHKLLKLQESQSLIDEKELGLLKRDIEIEEKKLSKLNKLYEAGGISLDALEEYKHSLEMLQANFAIEKIRFHDAQRERLLEIEAVNRQIKEINDDIEEIKRKSSFYSSIEKDGIYYAEMPGVILKNSKTNQILSPDEAVVEIGIVGEKVGDLMFSGYISEEDGSNFKPGDILNVELNKPQKEVRFKPQNMYFVEEKGEFIIEGELMRELPSNVLVNRSYKGEIKKIHRAENIIPKSAVIASELVEGGKGIVYIIETVEGILGSQHIAREVQVEITGVGDQISVEGLEEYENPRVITSLSHRIKDGVKVTHGF